MRFQRIDAHRVAIHRAAAGAAAAAFLALVLSPVAAADHAQDFAGVVTAASPEATAAGVEILEAGGNAVDAAVAVSMALGVTEPAGSGLGGRIVMLVYPGDGRTPFVIQGLNRAPASIPADATKEQLSYGHTATTIPSTVRVLDSAQRRFGSGRVSWARALEPAIRLAREGYVLGPFRARSLARYAPEVRRNAVAAGLFLRPDGQPFQVGDLIRQPVLAGTLQTLAERGAVDFYRGGVAAAIARDMVAHGGWITAADLAAVPEPEILAPLEGRYHGHVFWTLPEPYGGPYVRAALAELEQLPAEALTHDGTQRQLALIDSLMVAHRLRRARTAPAAGADSGGETSHFSIVDGDGMIVTATQSINGYYGAQVASPELGFLYNNYMRPLRPGAPEGDPHRLRPGAVPYSSMSATVVARDGRPVLVLGSPGSERIVSAVTQVTSYWIDVGSGIGAAVAARRVHVAPESRAYLESLQVAPESLAGLAARRLTLVRPDFGVADGEFDPYFGGVHAIAWERDGWVGAADPRRDGRVGYARHSAATEAAPAAR